MTPRLPTTRPPATPVLLRADAWLRANLRRTVRALLIAQIAGFAFLVAGTHGAFTPMPNPPTTTDFASFIAAGRLANQGRAADAYNTAAHRAAEAAIIAPGVDEKPFLNPPIFLLVCAPLARLPYLPGFVLFEAITFAAWLLLATRIAGGGRLACACLAAVPPVWWALGWGQNAFLSAGLIGGATLLLPRRPLLAGLLFGALCFKPHFGLLVPVALLAGRHWRVLLGAASSTAALTALSVICFGTASWTAFLAAANRTRAAVETGFQLSGHVDAGSAARLAGLPPAASWMLQAAVTLLAAAAVAWAWSGAARPGSRPADSAAATAAATANAILVAATLAAMPFVLFYDLVMAAVAAAWLVRAARQAGWRPAEPAGLATAWVIGLVAFPAAALLHLALGALVAPLLLWLASSRLRAGQPQPSAGILQPA